MTRSERIVVLIPAAPRDDVADTVRSVSYWMPSSPIVVINDTDSDLDLPRANVVVLPALPFPRNAYGGLWTKLGYGLDWIAQNFECDYVLRLDADAVVLRSGLDLVVGRAFVDKAVGIAGGVHLHGDGSRRNFDPAMRAILAASSIRGLRRPRVRRFVRQLLASARANGYQVGEHAIACACLLSINMIEAWRQAGWLRSTALVNSKLGDDFIMALMCHAAGYRLAEVGGPDGLFCLSWRGLPSSPHKLLAGPAFVTHSVRRFEGMSEREVRTLFELSRDMLASGIDARYESRRDGDAPFDKQVDI